MNVRMKAKTMQKVLQIKLTSIFLLKLTILINKESFIIWYLLGIITDSESEQNIQELLKLNNQLKKVNVIFLNEKNIDNIKNVHLDTIIINRTFNKMDKLINVINNAKNIVINMDVQNDFQNTSISAANLITYGFNSKSSITISSVTDDDVLICVQRNINNNFGVVEVQEIKIENNEKYSIYDLIIILIMFLINISTFSEIHIKSKK